MSAPKSISLYCRTGTSDKVYNVQLWPDGSGWQVFFQYGRRGASRLASGSKLPAPAYYWTAKMVYDELVESKTKKGYTAGALSGSSAMAAPSLALAAATVDPPPTWDGFEALYAQTATVFGRPSSLVIAPNPALLLLTWLSVELEDGLQDAARLVMQVHVTQIQTKSWSGFSAYLDEDSLSWLQSLPPNTQEYTLLEAQSFAQSLGRTSRR